MNWGEESTTQDVVNGGEVRKGRLNFSELIDETITLALSMDEEDQTLLSLLLQLLSFCKTSYYYPTSV